MRQEVLRLERVTCVRDGVTVLDGFNLHVFEGEVMGLVFVDAHGKQELVELIRHNTPVHYGMVYFRDVLVNSYRHSGAGPNGVTLIEKQSYLVDGMTVADNVFVLRGGFKKYVIQSRVLRQQFDAFAKEMGVDIRGGVLVKNLSPYEKSVVQLLKAMILGHRLIIIQDISNTVSAADLADFHALLHRAAAQGIGVLYVCSHHEEAFAVCDRAALVENGQVQRIAERRDFAESYFKDYLLDTEYFGTPQPRGSEGDSVLRLENVCTENLQNVNFALVPGECVVLLDASNTALGDVFDLLRGTKKPTEGEVRWPPDDGARPLMGFVQELPTKSMLYYDFSYLENLCFLAGEKQPRLYQKMKESVEREYRPLVGNDINAQDLWSVSATGLYSLVYYSQHLYNPQVLVVMQPFFGADMYLRRHILSLINKIRSRGTAVLLLAINISDSPVVADRMLVLQNGCITREYGRQEMERLNRLKEL